MERPILPGTYIGPPATGGRRVKKFPLAMGETASLMDPLFIESLVGVENGRGLPVTSARGLEPRSIRILHRDVILELVRGVPDRPLPPRVLEVVSQQGSRRWFSMESAPAVVKVIDRTAPNDESAPLSFSAVSRSNEWLIRIDREENHEPPHGVVWNSETLLLETLTQGAIDRLLRPETLVGLYREMIQEHVERRAALFFQQLIVVFGTQLEFSVGKTVAQAASGKALVVLNPQGNQVTICPFQGAHSATLPSLYAQYRVGGDRRRFAFMVGAGCSNENNATNNLPEVVNKADSLLDWQTRGQILRSRALELLNQASVGEVEPQEAMRRFLGAISIRVGELIRRDLPPGERLVLIEFGRVAWRLRQEIDDGAAKLFDHWLGIRVDHSAEAAAVRQLVYRLRYLAVRRNQLGQVEMSRMIDETSRPWRRNLNYFDAVLRHRLIDAMPTDDDKNRLRIFFNHSGALRLTGRRTSCWNTTDSALGRHHEAIKDLARRLSRHMYHMRVGEGQERADILRRVRNARGWSQAGLGERIRVFHPHEPSSQPTISRCETGVRVINDDLAGKLAEVTGVDAGIFMPTFFNG